MSRKNKKNTKNWPVGLLARFNSIFALLLLLSYLAYYIPPAPFWPLGLIGLAYPIFLILNILFVFLWVFLKKKYLFISLISILLGWNHIGNHFQLIPSKENQSEKGIRILTYNARLSRITATGKNPELLSAWLKSNQNQIICLQESYFPARGKTHSLHSIAPGYKISSFQRREGLAILTNLPSKYNGEISAQNRVFCVFSDLISNEDTIRIYNTQLASNYLDDEISIFDKDAEMKQQELQRRASNLVRKLINGYQRRVKEVKALRKHIDQSPYPVILCGDFNNTPLSYTYHHLKNNRFIDSFHKQQSIGLGNTYNGKMPPIRIDYILHDKSFKTLSYKKMKVDFSDHYPLQVVLASPNKQ